MTLPTTTSEIPDIRAYLQAEFERVAKQCFADSLEAMRKVDLYKAVLRRLEQGLSIEDEVPEAKGLSTEKLIAVVSELMTRATISIKHSWNLTKGYKDCFKSSIRMALPDREILPQFDVEHVGQTDAGEVKIKIKTWRRNIEIVVQGSDAAIEKLWEEMSSASLLNRYSML